MIAVVALSARAIVEAACGEGLRCSAIDAFGDVDTRRLAARWRPAGRGRLEIDAILDALRAARDEDGATAWIAGSGFEGHADWLEAAAALLPLKGTTPADRARIDDARHFFTVLDEAGVPHPPVRFDPPPQPDGWLAKRPGAGGLQVLPAGEGGDHWQLERRGAEPLSATLVADGRRAFVLGLNRQWTDPGPRHPYRFGGIAGPLPGHAALQRDLQAIADRLVPRLGLRGLASIDVLLHDGRLEVLEVNARPPASLALYPQARPVHAHLQAYDGTLPAPVPADGVRGVAIVYAPRDGVVDAALADRIASMPGTHDWPPAGQPLGAGDPLCSVSAAGTDLDDVQAQLARRRAALLALMETNP